MINISILGAKIFNCFLPWAVVLKSQRSVWQIFKNSFVPSKISSFLNKILAILKLTFNFFYQALRFFSCILRPSQPNSFHHICSSKFNNFFKFWFQFYRLLQMLNRLIRLLALLINLGQLKVNDLVIGCLWNQAFQLIGFNFQCFFMKRFFLFNGREGSDLGCFANDLI